MFDRDAFEERAAIAEFDGGLSRFEAETLAAKAQGLTRWQALEEIKDEDGKRNLARGGDHGSAHVGNGSDHLPRVQRSAAEQDGSVPERVVPAGRGGVALLALRA
jgi:hypothetical protein